MLKATIILHGNDTESLSDALAEAARLIAEGYTSAPYTRGEGSSFSFQVDEEATVGND